VYNVVFADLFAFKVPVFATSAVCQQNNNVLIRTRPPNFTNIAPNLLLVLIEAYIHDCIGFNAGINIAKTLVFQIQQQNC